MQADTSDKSLRASDPWRRFGRSLAASYARIWLATTALSGATLLFPQTVSRSYEDYTANNPMLSDCRQDFNARSLRVYHRLHPLVAFHEAGIIAQAYFRTGHILKGARAVIGGPFTATYALVANYSAEAHYPGVNAFSISTGGDLGTRRAYIYPTGRDIEPEDILRLHGFDVAGQIRFDAGRAAVTRLLHDWILLHEARHGDQDHATDGSTREADADVYALQLLKTYEGDTAAYAEARNFIFHLRTISGMDEQASLLRRAFNPLNANNHMTSLAIADGAASAETSRRTVRAFGDFLTACETAGPEQSLPPREKWYVAACNLLDGGKLDGNPDARRVAGDYVAACDYFSRLCGYPLPFARGIGAKEPASRQVIAAAQDTFRVK